MTTRANPSASWQKACRHFFRHIDDARELRRNPIAEPFFAVTAQHELDCDSRAIDAIRATILAATEKHYQLSCAAGRAEEGRRHRTIMASHILDHAPPQRIADELHLSRSQFYRERQFVCDRVARMIKTSNTPHESVPSAVLSSDVIALSRAKVYLESCEPQRALAILQDLGHESTNIASRVEALCLIADHYAEELREEQAENEIRTAQTLLAQNAVSVPCATVSLCEARIDLAMARLYMRRGHRDAAEDLTREALRLIHCNAHRDHEGDERAVDGLLLASEQAFKIGEFQRFRDCLGAACSLFSSLPAASDRQRAKLLLMSGHRVHDKNDDLTFKESNALHASALDIAQRAGLTRIAINAAMCLGLNRACEAADFKSALACALPALEAALQTSDAILIGSVCIDTAAVQNMSRRYGEALAVLETGRQRGKFDIEEAAVLQYELSSSYVGLRQYTHARKYAAEAYELSVKARNKRGQGAGLRNLAISHYYSGDPVLARKFIGQALEVVEQHGIRHALATTYALSANITGNQEHARQARSLAPRG